MKTKKVEEFRTRQLYISHYNSAILQFIYVSEQQHETGLSPLQLNSEQFVIYLRVTISHASGLPREGPPDFAEDFEIIFVID